MTELTLQDIHKSFGAIRVLDGVSFAVARGEIVAVLGPSGCGKSTLLSVVAGLEAPQRGRVLWRGDDLAGVPPHKRGFGLMFQDYALFPHKDVFANVAFGLHMAGVETALIKQRVAEVLTLVGLPDFGRRDVNQLSGGEQQRVALARSLAPQPGLLMLDEPLGSLDRALRERLLLDLQAILRHTGQTTLYVTHDQEEAYALADRIVILNAGQVVQVGTPQQLYRRPASRFVAQFLGLSNLLTGHVRHGEAGKIVETPVGTFPLAEDAGPGEVTLLLRPDAVHLGVDGPYHLKGTLVERIFRGNTTEVVLALGDHRLKFELLSAQPLPALGESVGVSFDPRRALQIIGEN